MRNKENTRKILWLVLAVIWMLLIFWFSHQKASASSEISGSLTWRLAECVNHVLHLDWKEATLLQYAVEWEHPVRKAAHMTEYAVFSWILLGNSMQYPKLKGKEYCLAEAGAVLYAASDEFHQLFIEGRSGQVSDVCIDGIGALLGLLLACAVLTLIYKIRKRKR